MRRSLRIGVLVAGAGLAAIGVVVSGSIDARLLADAAGSFFFARPTATLSTTIVRALPARLTIASPTPTPRVVVTRVQIDPAYSAGFSYLGRQVTLAGEGLAHVTQALVGTKAYPVTLSGTQITFTIPKADAGDQDVIAVKALGSGVTLVTPFAKVPVSKQVVVKGARFLPDAVHTPPWSREILLTGDGVGAVTWVTIGSKEYPVRIGPRDPDDGAEAAFLYMPKADDETVAAAKALGSGVTAHTLFGDVPVTPTVSISAISMQQPLTSTDSRVMLITGTGVGSLTWVRIGTKEYPARISTLGNVRVTIPKADDETVLAAKSLAGGVVGHGVFGSVTLTKSVSVSSVAIQQAIGATNSRDIVIEGPGAGTITHVLVGTKEYPARFTAVPELVRVTIPKSDDQTTPAAKLLIGGVTAYGLFGTVPVTRAVTVQSVQISTDQGGDRAITVIGSGVGSTMYATVGSLDRVAVMGSGVEHVRFTHPKEARWPGSFTLRTLFGDVAATGP